MTQMDGGDDAAEVARARSGDEDAFRRLVEGHSSRLFRVAYRMTGNVMDAEDVVQETFLKAYQRLKQFEERASFGTWLHRIAVHSACDLLRRRKAQPTIAGGATGSDEDWVAAAPAAEPGPDRLAEAAQVQHRVARAMSRLSDQERTAFVLRHFEQMSTREIGAALGVDDGAAKHSVFRAVRKLREALEVFVSAPRTETESR
jgi:RNA polymerase sigma-70 factor (ECF subfamily)